MAEEIVNKVSNLKITEVEDQLIAFDDAGGDDNNSDLELYLVGKVLIVRTYNFEALKRTLNQVWAISNGALFCSIDQNLVLLNEIDPEVQPSNINLTFCPFWVRLYNMPMGFRSDRHVRAVGRSMGEVLEVESDGSRWHKSARIRILLDVTKPLRRVQRIALKNGESTLVELKYERLPTFCYVCVL
ncbi:uncharacterized protein LOC109135534 [Beta vulgaris subsp. vulgaris]|uniref:uncharacterized protein LOC109135534 n=1 Tax=Beta vulgaris subsp. vulgaris TaxID=3555 RepID=UPI000901F6EA|nr:uncharacterized protein LOC109135534 [Beta vulgaris subsp. vulgaris]